VDGTINRAEGLKAEICGRPETQIPADRARESVSFDLGVDVIVRIRVDERFSPVGKTEFRPHSIHALSEKFDGLGD
jgi:hypothetical protein